MANTLRNRYSKSLSGLNAQGFFSPTGGNTTVVAAAATLESLLSAGAEGDIGVFDADTNLGIDSTTALAAGTNYYIAQLVDGLIKKSVTFDGGDVELTQSAYDAPVIQESVIGSNGTTGDLNINIAGGLQEFVARINEITPANQPFPTVEGRAVVRSSSGIDDYDIADKIVKDLNDVYDYEANSDDKATIAEVLMEGASAAFVPAAVTVGIHYPGQSDVEVDDSSGMVVGDYLTFATAPSTDDPVFEITAISVADVLTLNRPLTEEIAAGVDVTEKTYVAGTTPVGIRIQATAEDVVFSLGVSEDLAAADILAITEWKQGSGAAWQVAAMEKETQVFAGDTVQNVAFAADYGQPTSFVDADATGATSVYDLSFLKYKVTTDSMAFANDYQTTFGYIIIGSIGVTMLGNAF